MADVDPVARSAAHEADHIAQLVRAVSAVFIEVELAKGRNAMAIYQA